MPKSFAFNEDTRCSSSGFAITPSDVTVFADNALPRGVYVGGDGNLTVLLEWDTASITLVGVKAGSLLPIRPVRVLATGTTATNLVGLL